MALQNPSGLYTGGAANLDPSFYLQIALRARQQREARDQAIDKYYMNLPNTINDRGVRDQEIPIINAMRDKIMEYGMQNREALKNPKIDNGAAQLGIQKLFREAQGITRMSQEAAKADLEVGKMRLNKEGQWIFDNDDFIKLNQLHNLPVTDPNFKMLDINPLMTQKPWDDAEYMKEIKNNFKYGEDIPTIVDHPTDKNLQVVTTNPVLDDPNKKALFTYSAGKYHNDRRFREKIQEDLKNGVVSLPQLGEVFKKTFNKEIETDEDLAAAYTLNRLPVTSTKAKVRTNIEERDREWDRRNRLTFQQSMDKIRANKKQNIPAQDTGYISDEVGAENGVDIVFPEKKSWTGAITPERTVRFIPISQVDPERLNIIIGKNTSKGLFGVKPMTITMPDGTKQVGYEQDQITGDWVGDKGQIISREAAKDRYINTVGNTAFKSKQNTRASENTNFDRSHNTNKKTQPKQAKKDPLGIF